MQSEAILQRGIRSGGEARSGDETRLVVRLKTIQYKKTSSTGSSYR